MDAKTIAIGLVSFAFIVLFLVAKWDYSKLEKDLQKLKTKHRSELAQKDLALQEKINELSKEKIVIQKEAQTKKVILEQEFNDKALTADYWRDLNDKNRAFHVEKLDTLRKRVQESFEMLIQKADAALSANDLRSASAYAMACFALKPEDPGAQRLLKRVQDLRYVNKLQMAFIMVPKGTFKMGSIASEKMRKADEEWHQVTISKPFYMMETEVTQEQWDAVMNSPDQSLRKIAQIVTPSAEKGAQLPVENVSYHDINSFLAKINSLGIGQYRLPTEAEWEYAARANESGTFGDNDAPNATAWFSKNSQRKPQPVGTKFPNSFGLYDMLGNVAEWVSDNYANFTNEAAVDPKVTQPPGYRVFRGGSFKDSETGCRIANRNKGKDDFTAPHLGFRLVYEPTGN